MCGILTLSSISASTCGKSVPSISVIWDYQTYACEQMDIYLYIGSVLVASCKNGSSLNYTPGPCDFGPGKYTVSAYGYCDSGSYQDCKDWIVEEDKPEVNLNWDLSNINSDLFTPTITATVSNSNNCSDLIEIYLDGSLLIQGEGTVVSEVISYSYFKADTLVVGSHTISAIAKNTCGISDPVECKFVIGNKSMGIGDCCGIHIIPILFINPDKKCKLVARYECQSCCCPEGIPIPIFSITDLKIDVTWAEISSGSSISQTNHIEADFTLGSGTVGGIIEFDVPYSSIYSITGSSSSICTGFLTEEEKKVGIVAYTNISGQAECIATINI